MNFLYPKKQRFKAPINSAPAMLVPLASVKVKNRPRIQTGLGDKSFGGSRPGIVITSTNLVGGAPGAGKSTFLLQLSDKFVGLRNMPTVYLAAEQAKDDLKELADRLELENADRILIIPAIGREFFDISPLIEKARPCMFVIDSLQAFAGNNFQRQLDLCKRAKVWATTMNAPGFLVSQVTKEDELAGLMAFQHEVDSVSKFVKHESDKAVRILGVMKNRNGMELDTAFRMTDKGLVTRGDEVKEEAANVG